VAASSTPLTVDVVHWLSRTTLDIIGLAGFNYDFNTLRQGEDGTELAAAFHGFNAAQEYPLLMILKGFIPPLRLIEFDKGARQAQKLRRVMRKVGLQLIEDKQQKITAEKASNGGTVLEKKGVASNLTSSLLFTPYRARIGHDRDLLSLMMRSNMSTTTPPEQRLSVEQILNQIPTFLLAG